MLERDMINTLVSRMRRMHEAERPRFDRIYGFVRGDLGTPNVPEAAEQEIKDIARISRKNVISLVVDSFVQNLSVIGYRHANATDDALAWRRWQEQRMDARQAEVHRAACSYGVSYLTITKRADGRIVWRPRSPRQLMAVYEEPQIDAWPQYALELYRDETDGQPTIKGYLIDDEAVYPLDFGSAPIVGGRAQSLTLLAREGSFEVGTPVPHGAVMDGEPVCPVVRYVNGRDADDLIIGEVEPLIIPQLAINEVNNDRLIVARFGAFPQKVISGWTSTPDKVLKAAASRVWSFDDPDVNATTLAPAAIEPYNALLAEMMEHVAMIAQISPSQVTGKMINLSAEALAAGEANQQRKIGGKRESFGESHEQALRLDSAMRGIEDTEDVGAEAIWKDTEARSFGSVVDGVTKLASAGVPVDLILSMIPGLTQPQISAIRERLTASEDIMTALQSLSGAEAGGAQDQQSDGASEAAELKAKFDALGVAIRAGVEPENAAARLGLAGLAFTGAIPVSLRLPESDAAGLEEK